MSISRNCYVIALYRMIVERVTIEIIDRSGNVIAIRDRLFFFRLERADAELCVSNGRFYYLSRIPRLSICVYSFFKIPANFPLVRLTFKCRAYTYFPFRARVGVGEKWERREFGPRQSTSKRRFLESRLVRFIQTIFSNALEQMSLGTPKFYYYYTTVWRRRREVIEWYLSVCKSRRDYDGVSKVIREKNGYRWGKGKSRNRSGVKNVTASSSRTSHV